MSSSRGRKIKALRSNPYQDPTVFFMSLEEAKNLISSKFEFENLAERHETVRSKRAKPAHG